MESLFAERDFQPEVCQQNLKEFTACMVALNFLANNLPTPLQFRVDVLSDEPILLVQKNENENIAEQIDQFKESLSVVFNQKAPIDISKHYWRLFKLAQEIDVDVSYYAGETMNIYLGLAYDPHSALLPTDLLFPSPENYFGIGSYIIKNRIENADDAENPAPTIMKPMKGSPAMKAGLKAGDMIYKVDGVDFQDKTINEVAAAIKGPQGSTVTLTVKRICSGEMEEVQVQRGPITVAPDIIEDSYYVNFDASSADVKKAACADNTVDSSKPQALVIPVAHFDSSAGGSGQATLCQKFNQLLEEDMANTNSIGLIVDLRENPGGDVQQVSCMLDLLINSEELLLGVHTVDRGEVIEGWDEEYGHFDTYQAYTKPVIVLTGPQSASASEIFAGTIQDMKRGWVVGDKTFGKGSIQTLQAHTFKPDEFEHSYNYKGSETVIKTTTGIYFLNSGRSPQLQGITPDFRFSAIGEAITEDNQTAIEISESVNVIKGFEVIEWEQTRPDEVEEITACAQGENSLSEIFKGSSFDELPKQLGIITNYQDFLARDILTCLAKQ